MTELSEFIDRRLIGFRVGTSEPCWSSYSLNEFIANAVAAGGTAGDVFQPAYLLIGRSELSCANAFFIKELAITMFSMFRKSYESSDLQWLQDKVSSGCTTAQGYFALYTLPAKLLAPSCVLAILKALAGTPYWREAVANLEDESENEDVRKLLREWLSMGVDNQIRDDVERMAAIEN